ncbi:ABC transporter substrate-binding protein [Aeromicrobium wangtongii]|uniref:ABC transporter substrate-binding protein n=1 Tax=Aeromicrobium wangtongii TaxID=2969247 RepID=A0ABY5M523_9ACTN|nr:ABC transporter substrate-binding protein [Aeromicrobium wangtongii]MCD9199062.1 ABC transporter substrate-binding protein [Aeromicrobium wangtongii]UUP12907.1 ABC transporter substrate-binding protein [Aeromicrobium wangtongii]
MANSLVGRTVTKTVRTRTARMAAGFIALTLVTAACAAESDGGNAADGSAGGDTPTAVADNPAAVTDLVKYTGGSAGAADDSLEPVTLGWVNQQGGALGFPSATDGAEAAVKYINKNLGGIGGHPVKLETCFVVENEQDGNACGLKLVNNKAVKTVLFGSTITGNQSFLAVNKGQKPVLMANSISSTDAQADNVFIFNGNPGSIFRGLATYLGTVVKAKKVSVIYPQDAQSADGVKVLERALGALDIDVKAVGFDPSTTNLTSAAVASGAADADAIIPLVSSPPACVAAAKALDTLKVKAPVVSAGAFCFSAPVAQGLGGEAPKWQQISTQTNVADKSQPDVQTYVEASSKTGLSPQSQSTPDAALAWGLVFTAARLANAAGGADATEVTIAEQAKSFAGPLLLGSQTLSCGSDSTAPGLCGAQTRVFEYSGNGAYKALTDWLDPSAK